MLQKGLTEGAAKLRAAIWLEETTGLTLTAPIAAADVSPGPFPTRSKTIFARVPGVSPEMSAVTCVPSNDTPGARWT